MLRAAVLLLVFGSPGACSLTATVLVSVPFAVGFRTMVKTALSPAVRLFNVQVSISLAGFAVQLQDPLVAVTDT